MLSRNFNRDELFKLALEFDLPTLLSFCASSKEINNKICNDDLWLRLLNRDFPDYNLLKYEGSNKQKYILLTKLTRLKQKLNLEHNIYELYNLQELSLRNNRIKEIPKELGNLINLKELYLSYNQIEKIPKELGNLTNLLKLYTGNNQIKEIPKELGNLTNLQNLYFSYNQIKRYRMS